MVYTNIATTPALFDFCRYVYGFVIVRNTISEETILNPVIAVSYFLINLCPYGVR